MENKMKKIDEYRHKVEEQMMKLGFNSEKIQQEIMFALAIYNDPKNSYLRKSTEASILRAITNIAAVGLTLNPVVKEAYLIPRKNSLGKVEAHLEPSYIGLINLLGKSGIVTNITANVYYENDDFECNLGTNEIYHKPYYLCNKPESGKKIAAYAIAFLTNGTKQIEVMPMTDIYEIRDTSESYKAYKASRVKSSIWTSYEDEMIKKTVIKRLTKKLPRKKINDNLVKAIELTNDDYLVKDYQITQIDNLLINASITEDEKEQHERSLGALNYHSANQLIEYLKMNQLNPIESGLNYSQSDINKQLDLKLNK